MCGRCGIRDYREWKPHGRPLEVAHLRLRPAMYVGAVGAGALRWVADELLHNAMNEVLADRCGRIEVTVSSNRTITVSDNGPGIAAEAMTAIYGGSAWDETPKSTPVVPTWRLGVAVATALAERLEVVSAHAGESVCQSFSRGAATSSVEPARHRQGTSVTFEADPTIFGDAAFDPVGLVERCRELAHLRPGVTLQFTDARASSRSRVETFHVSERAAARMAMALAEEPVLSTPISCSAAVPAEGGGEIRAEAAITWDRVSKPQGIRSYANLLPTNCGGSHENGLRRALRRMGPEVTRGRYALADGLVAVVSVIHPRPRLKGTSYVSLETEDVGPVVAACVEAGIREFLSERAGEADVLRESFRASARRRP